SKCATDVDPGGSKRGVIRRGGSDGNSRSNRIEINSGGGICSTSLLVSRAECKGVRSFAQSHVERKLTGINCDRQAIKRQGLQVTRRDTDNLRAQQPHRGGEINLGAIKGNRW